MNWLRIIGAFNIKSAATSNQTMSNPFRQTLLGIFPTLHSELDDCHSHIYAYFEFSRRNSQPGVFGEIFFPFLLISLNIRTERTLNQDFKEGKPRFLKKKLDMAPPVIRPDNVLKVCSPMIRPLCTVHCCCSISL